MSGSKPPAPPVLSASAPRGRGLRMLLRPGPGRRMFVLLLVGFAIAAGWMALWRHVRDRVIAGDQYRLRIQQIEITPRPAWIRADIRAEAIRDGSLDSPLSILDDDLTVRIAKAFELHPWIAEVKGVTKHHPARMTVELVYRRPVAMVVVPGGLYAIDIQAIVLPSDDFSPVEATRYPRLAGMPGVSSPVAGTRWTDDRVIGAAQIAAQLLDDWHSLALHRIEPLPVGSAADALGPQYLIISRADARIVWGHPPGEEAASELPAAEKLSLLRRASEAGALSRSIELDLRRPSGTSSPPQRTARRPGRERYGDEVTTQGTGSSPDKQPR
jgi:hypothetical protein